MGAMCERTSGGQYRVAAAADRRQASARFRGQTAHRSHRRASLPAVIRVSNDMRMTVTDVAGAFESQTGIYAEYRIFSTLAKFSTVVSDVDVTLAATSDGATLCEVVAIVGDGVRVHARAGEWHACDAIDQAARRIAGAVGRHIDVLLSS